MTVLEYLESNYRKTNWNYFNSVKLYRELGDVLSSTQISKEIDLLISSGKIRKREGINCYVVELII